MKLHAVHNPERTLSRLFNATRVLVQANGADVPGPELAVHTNGFGSSRRRLEPHLPQDRRLDRPEVGSSQPRGQSSCVPTHRPAHLLFPAKGERAGGHEETDAADQRAFGKCLGRRCRHRFVVSDQYAWVKQWRADRFIQPSPKQSGVASRAKASQLQQQ